MKRLMIVTIMLGAVGCSSPDAAAFDAERPWRQPGDVIDSILPMEEHERRFREGLPVVTAFTGGEASREALAQRIVEAVSAQDTAALRTVLVNRAEFAWLVFPDHVYRRPPYELDPGTFWMQVQQGSAKGMARLLERHGGRPMQIRELQCERDTLQFVPGPLRAWRGCVLEYQAGDSLLARQLFGTVVQLGGVVKLLGYSNDF